MDFFSKAEPGLKKVAEKDKQQGVGIVANKHLMAYGEKNTCYCLHSKNIVLYCHQLCNHHHIGND